MHQPTIDALVTADDLPNLLIIGAQKCGTTSLHRYLDLHPDIAMAPGKELDFFIDTDRARGFVLPGNWHRGVDWYTAQFPSTAAVRGEASPNYTMYPYAPAAPRRAARIVPDARLIYLVRDPIDRIVSGYLHRRATGRERRSLDEILDRVLGRGEAGASELVARSRYHAQLSRWLECFPLSRVMVVDADKLQLHRPRTLAAVFSFLGVRDDVDAEQFEQVHAESSGRREPRGLVARAPQLQSPGRLLPAPLRKRFERAVTRSIQHPDISARNRERLEALLRSEVEALRKLTGEPFEHWSL